MIVELLYMLYCIVGLYIYDPGSMVAVLDFITIRVCIGTAIERDDASDSISSDYFE